MAQIVLGVNAMKNGQFPAVLPLASLNGENGFKIDGENPGDFSGIFVNSAGDVDGDGYLDIIIGAEQFDPGFNPTEYGPGRAYVIFGGNSGFDSLISLSKLDGVNGFRLMGEQTGDRCGFRVSCAGDINEDGYSDLLIGAVYASPGGKAQAGRSYVFFGGANVGGTGTFNLSNLNGSNGFKLDGEYSGDQSAVSLSALGDINADNHADLLIGAYGFNSGTGRSYVVFGGLEVGSNGVIMLSSLNGTNGFKIDGEAAGDSSGDWVCAAGNINNDGYNDLLIGSPSRNSQTGRTYAVFGGPGIGKNNNGVIALSSLDGKNGFKLDGESAGDWSGFRISAIGDINTDNVTDIMIGAYHHNNAVGRAYIVFGDENVGSNGVIALSNLNGVNGFKLDGEVANSFTGCSINSAGDFNGDGWADLVIGAYGYNNNAGRSYVVFSDPNTGKTGMLQLGSLNGVNGFKLDGEISNGYSGRSVSSVGDINGDSYPDLLIGAFGYGNNAGRSYVIFGDTPPVLVTNQMNISVGEKVRMNTTDLSAYDLNHNNDTLLFILTGVSHGRFESLDNPGIPLANFTQQRISNGEIQFVHDGTLMAPSYSVSVHTTGIGYVASTLAKITFTSLKPPPSVFPAVIPLSSLNGKTGFIIDGQSTGDYSSSCVSTAGDINSDGIADIFIGAEYALSGSGRSYLIFGAKEIGKSGLFSLSTLNGANGFKLDGEMGSSTNPPLGDRSGISVSNAGDVNSDGYDDLLVGAVLASPNGVQAAGRSYAIFGGPQVGNSGSLPLSSLNGLNGFKLNGEATNDWSGVAVNAIGDVNNDGHNDFIIGAPQHNKSIGRSYVIFGNSNGANPGLISLTNLNGQNGFKLDGDLVSSYSGYWVGNIGDINRDSYDDILIGAPNRNNFTGSSYVVFGSSNLGSNGLISLSSLNGANGFRLDGEAMGDSSGFSIGGSTVGDVNGDGYLDFIIGAKGYNSKIGRSYVIFGNDEVSDNGLQLLANLNGKNGFKIDGESAGDGSGFVTNLIGDFNGDGYADLGIGSYGHNKTGRFYLFFGGPEVGKKGLISLTDLNGVNGIKLNGEAAGDYGDNNLGSVSTAGDINNDGIADLLIGAPGHNKNTGRTYVIFGDVAPQLMMGPLTVHQNQTVILNSQNLNATDFNHPAAGLRFNVTDVQQGYFSLVNSTNQSITSFNQSQIWNSQIQFVHDSSQQAPSYTVQVQSDGLALPPPPQAADITFHLRPSFIHNQLTILEGETVLMTANELSLQDDYPDTQILFIISDCQNGQFELIPAKNATTIQFTQQQVNYGQIQFVHNNKPIAPSYQVTASDGYFTIGPVSSVINFSLVDKSPALVNPIPPETFAVGESFNFKIAADTFYDEQGKPIQLSSALADGSPLPEEITFDPPTSTFTGLMNSPEDYNISVTATSVAQLSTVTFFALKIAERTSPDSPLIDLKTLSSVLSTIGGFTLTCLSYLYYRRLQRIEREADNPFAEEIHKKLGLS
jgi:hypothetical protein